MRFDLSKSVRRLAVAKLFIAVALCGGLTTFFTFGLAVQTAAAFANAVVPDASFGSADFQSLGQNDDDSTGLVSFGFNINFFGTEYSGGYVNNNGNLTFGAAMSTFTAFGLGTTSTPIIAPFFADVDTLWYFGTGIRSNTARGLSTAMTSSWRTGQMSGAIRVTPVSPTTSSTTSR